MVDRSTKMKLYEANQVQEYWIVDPRKKSIEVYVWREKGYEMVYYAEEMGEIRSDVLVDFSLDVTQVFGAS
jgi:Uma2 family endonuclease